MPSTWPRKIRAVAGRRTPAAGTRVTAELRRQARSSSIGLDVDGSAGSSSSLSPNMPQAFEQPARDEEQQESGAELTRRSRRQVIADSVPGAIFRCRWCGGVVGVSGGRSFARLVCRRHSSIGRSSNLSCTILVDRRVVSRLDSAAPVRLRAPHRRRQGDMCVAAHFVVTCRERAVPGAGFAEQCQHLVRFSWYSSIRARRRRATCRYLSVRTAANEFLQRVGRVLVHGSDPDAAVP